MDSPWKVELAEAYFNSWQSAHREVCRLETLIAEKDREIERLRTGRDNAYLDKENLIKSLVSLCLVSGIITRGMACKYLGCGREELDEILDKVATEVRGR